MTLAFLTCILLPVKQRIIVVEYPHGTKRPERRAVPCPLPVEADIILFDRALGFDPNQRAAKSNRKSGRENEMSVRRIDSNPRMSKVVVHGNTVYLAGLIADKTLGQGVAEQTREILSLIDDFLAKAGTDKSKLLTATIWLSDIRTVDEMNKVWDQWVAPGNTPARACIEALLQGPEKKIEIQVTAAL
jgi:enamine deaminase RidA (YjgF/YER057c/UK114 family)